MKEEAKQEREPEHKEHKEKRFNVNKNNNNHKKSPESSVASKETKEKVIEELPTGEIPIEVEEDKHNHVSELIIVQTKEPEEIPLRQQESPNENIPNPAKVSKKNSKPTTEILQKKIEKTKEGGINLTMRKKICVKMSQLFQEKHELTKEAAQEMTLKIEEKTRNSCSETEYRDNIIIILKLIKVYFRIHF